MTFRTVTTNGTGLKSAGGAPLSGVRIAFMLVNAQGRQAEDIDLSTGAVVSGDAIYVTTDALGEFSVNLFPNVLGANGTRYFVKVLDDDYDDFYAVLTDGPAPVDFADFKLYSNPAAPDQEALTQSYFDRLLNDSVTVLNKVWSSQKIMDVITNIFNGVKPYTHEQVVPALVWDIQHNLGRPVSIATFDNAGVEITGVVSKVDLNTSRVTFNVALMGEALVK